LLKEFTPLAHLLTLIPILKINVLKQPKKSKDISDGYSGRVGIFEVLPVSTVIKELITRRANADQIQEQAKREEMRTMVEDGLVKAAQGITSIEEVLRVITE